MSSKLRKTSSNFYFPIWTNVNSCQFSPSCQSIIPVITYSAFTHSAYWIKQILISWIIKHGFNFFSTLQSKQFFPSEKSLLSSHYCIPSKNSVNQIFFYICFKLENSNVGLETYYLTKKKKKLGMLMYGNKIFLHRPIFDTHLQFKKLKFGSRY